MPIIRAPRTHWMMSNTEIIIPISTLDGMSAEQIGETVLALVPAVQQWAIEQYNEYKPAPKPPKNRPGFVYIIRGEQYYKIGCTTTIKKRLRALDVKAPFAIETVLVIPTEDMSWLEDHLHRRFHQQHHKGEWFKLTASAIQALAHEYPTVDPRSLYVE